MAYQLAFTDFDEDKEIAQQFASQLRVQGTAITYTSTLADRSDPHTALGECELLSKSYSANELRTMLFEQAGKTAIYPVATIAGVRALAG